MPGINDDSERAKALRAAQKRAIFHGSLTIALGLAAGFPYTIVIFRDYATSWSAAEQHWLASDLAGKAITALYPVVTGTERAWRMAHLEGLLNGLVAWLAAALMPLLDGLSVGELDQLAVALAITGYGNALASILGAAYSVRGFAAAGSLANRTANALFTVAIGTIFRSVFLITKGVL